MVQTRASKAQNAAEFDGQTTSAVNGTKRSISDAEKDGQTSKRAKLSTRTDYSRWRMLDENGRQTWHYLKDDEAAKEWPQTTADKYFLGLPTVRSTDFRA